MKTFGRQLRVSGSGPGRKERLFDPHRRKRILHTECHESFRNRHSYQTIFLTIQPDRSHSNKEGNLFEARGIRETEKRSFCHWRLRSRIDKHSSLSLWFRSSQPTGISQMFRVQPQQYYRMVTMIDLFMYFIH